MTNLGESPLYLDSSLTDEGIDIEVWLEGGVTIDSADLVFTYAGDGVSFEGVVQRCRAGRSFPMSRRVGRSSSQGIH